MAAHLQMHGVRNQLSTRGMAIRMDNGEYLVSHKDGRYPETARRGDLTFALIAGLRMAGERENANKLQRGAR
jgi:hypothetical protein